MTHEQQIEHWRQIAEESKKNSVASCLYLEELVEQVTNLKNPKDRIAWWDELPCRKELLPEDMFVAGYIEGFDKWEGNWTIPNIFYVTKVFGVAYR